jgi:putative transposase
LDAEGWLYLCAVRDGCSRRVIGWALDQYLHTDLIQAAVHHSATFRLHSRRQRGLWVTWHL